MKRNTCFLLILALLFIAVLGSARKTFAWTTGPGISAESYCLLNAGTGEVILEKGSGVRMHPASITKIMTTLVTVEQVPDLDARLSVSENALLQIAPLSSTMDPMPRPGEHFSVRDVLYALIMKSGNECGNILAEYVAGDISSFVDLMNEKAARLGAKDTHFCNPHGLDEEEHLTTAYDMALIMKAAIANPAAREILSARSYTIPATNYCAERRMNSAHGMVNGSYDCAGVFAGKNGFTRLAQSTLVTAAERDGVTLIAVVLHCGEGCSYADTEILLNAGYSLLAGREPAAGSNVYNPVIHSRDADGFTVTWQLGEEAVWADFPVFIEYDPEDAMTREAGPVSGTSLSYRVWLADHGGKSGVYTVQAYVYDAAGNTHISTVKVLVPKDHTAGSWDFAPGRVEVDGSTYCIRENGSLGLQWQEMADGAYYFRYTYGDMFTGWFDNGGTLFYLDPDGRMHTGWLTLGEKTYYFQAAGDMVTGSFTIDGCEYFFDENGVLTGMLGVPQIGQQ